MASDNSYDYIVIGSGASGAVVANRLSADPGVPVLVLEAGGRDKDPNIHAVGGFVSLWGSAVDWKLNTEVQPGLAGRRITINQGKVMGGSTSINAMMYVRGNRRNFDQWAAMGAEGWGYADVLPYFKKLEDYEGGASEYHGVGGPISVRDCPEAVMRSDEFLNGAVEAGFDGPRWDCNGARQENGAGYLQFHIGKDGKRCSAATAFLDPVLDRPNLTLKTGAEVARILFDGKRAVGVEYLLDGQQRQVRAGREVILSAGALQSPKLLMLSGVGPADQLRKHNIPVVSDLAGVGRNLQDHVQLPAVFRTKSERPLPELLTGNVLFTNTRKNSPDAPPDLQLNFTPAVPRPLSAFLNFGGPACIFLAILVQPKSVGRVGLRSANPQDPPVIDPNYLQDPADGQTLVSALQVVRNIAGTKAFADLNAGEIAPGSGDPDGFIRSQASTLWHPAGTCKIGRGTDAVVDPRLRVHGVQGLRVADASIMPTVTSGNTVASCFMIGARAVDLIRAGSNFIAPRKRSRYATMKNVPDTALGKIYRAHIDFILKKDIESLLNQYTDDAVLISSFMKKPIYYRGRDQLREHMQGILGIDGLETDIAFWAETDNPQTLMIVEAIVMKTKQGDAKMRFADSWVLRDGKIAIHFAGMTQYPDGTVA